MSSIALGINVYNDAAALRGLLELGSRYFDNIYVLHTGPGGVPSTDGTIELCHSFGIQPVFDDIQKGFGHIRSRLIHDCGCDWCFIMDADERFYPQIEVITCDGTDRYPNPMNPKLTVTKKKDVINQGEHIKTQIKDPQLMALRMTRRHWFDFKMTKPAENWQIIWDHQMRCVRNHPDIKFTLDMHEALIDARTGKAPKFLGQDPIGGPFIDHFHLFFRHANPGHKEFNEANYARLAKGEKMIS